MTNDLPPLPGIELGAYEHYKGGRYEVVGVVRHSETLDPLVLYRHLEGPDSSALLFLRCLTVSSETSSSPSRRLGTKQLVPRSVSTGRDSSPVSAEKQHLRSPALAGDLWARPFKMFFEEVEYEWCRLPRFRKLE